MTHTGTIKKERRNGIVEELSKWVQGCPNAGGRRGAGKEGSWGTRATMVAAGAGGRVPLRRGLGTHG
jgi:hypothetical protein